MRYRTGIADWLWCTERTASGTPLLRVTVTLAAVLAACGGGDQRTERTASADEARDAPTASGAPTQASPSTGPASSTPVARPICPATGAWQICNVVERLERAGLAPRRQSSAAREEALSAPGVAFMLGSSELRVFVYADRAARERDQAKLDRREYLTPSEPLSMREQPTLIASENLLAVLRSRNEKQRERVSDALTAGPPQRPETKE